MVESDCCGVESGDEFQQHKQKLQLSNSKGRKKTAAERFVETDRDDKLTKMEKVITRSTWEKRVTPHMPVEHHISIVQTQTRPLFGQQPPLHVYKGPPIP